MSLFGHGPEGRVSDGYWSRIYCRAFVFVPDQVTPLAIVTCDLSAVGTLLQRSIAQALENDHVGIPASRLMLTATHTHAGPGHFFEGDFYGGFMSTRAPGFDPKMLDFLTTRIARAVEDALHAARPARLSWFHGAVDWSAHFTRNRSLVPFEQNDPPYVPGSGCGALAPPAGTPPDQRAIDPCLDVLSLIEVDDGGTDVGPIGSIAFFAMHPTVLPDTSRLIGADVDGVVSRVVEREMRKRWVAAGKTGRDPVHAIVNTNEGDISPVWSSGTTDEAVEIGTRLGHFIWDRGLSSTPVPAIVDARYVQVHLPAAPLLWHAGPALCETPKLGVAAPQGASDHRTALTLIGDFRDENVDETAPDPCSAPRKAFLDFIQQSASGSGSFPSDAPLAVAQLGDTLISFVPAEMTVTAGDRLAREVAAEALARGFGIWRSLVAGLANGYIQYVTTPEEYRLQHYEGASDLYGISTADFLSERYALLVRAMAGQDVSPWLPKIDEVQPYRYVTSATRPRLATGDGETPLADVVDRHVIDFCRLRGEPLSLCMSWKDAAPGVVPPVDGSPWVSVVDAATQQAAIDDAADPAFPVDDRGLDFQTRVQERAGNGYTWTTVFSPGEPTRAALRGRTLRLRVGSGRFALQSKPFSVDAPPKACGPVEVLNCGTGR